MDRRNSSQREGRNNSLRSETESELLEEAVDPTHYTRP